MNLIKITNTAVTDFVCMSNTSRKSPRKTFKKANNKTIAIGEK